MTANKKRKKEGVSTMGGTSDVHIFIVVDYGRMQEASYLAFIFIKIFVIEHSLDWGRMDLIQAIPKSAHAVAAENAEQLPLLLRKVWWCRAAVHCKVWSQESVHSGQTEVGKTRALVEQSLDSLDIVSTWLDRVDEKQLTSKVSSRQ